jgi:hypothetical protein
MSKSEKCECCGYFRVLYYYEDMRVCQACLRILEEMDQEYLDIIS